MRRLWGHLPSLLIVSFLCVGCSSQPDVQLPEHIKGLENLTVHKRPEHPDTLMLYHEQVFGNTPFRQGVSKVDFPETWPVMEQMLTDDEDRLWISIIVDDQETYQWWVLSEQGELLARFRWPRSSQIEVIKNGAVYARETEEETGLQQIVRYRFETD